MPELQLLRPDHQDAVLAFEVAERSWFARTISDRGDAFFGDYPSRHRSRLAEQARGEGAYYVLVDDSGTVLGRFNLIISEPGTAEVGYRVAEHATGHGVATAYVAELCRLAGVVHGVRLLRAATSDTNLASRRVLEKNGFVEVGAADPSEVGGRRGTWFERRPPSS